MILFYWIYFIFFADPPRDVENFTCISENWDNLNCTWVRKPLIWATFCSIFLHLNKKTIGLGNICDLFFCTWIRKALLRATFLVFLHQGIENHLFGQHFWGNHWFGQYFWFNCFPLERKPLTWATCLSILFCTWVRKSLTWATFLGTSLTWATFLVWFFWQLSTFSWPGWAVEPHPDQIPTHDQTGQLQICVSGYWWDRGVDLMVIGDSFVCLTWNLWFNLYL